MRIAASLLHFLVELGVLLLWIEILSSMVGLPVAWLKARRTRVWQQWPPGVGRLDALRRFVRPVPGRVAVAAVPTLLLLLVLALLLDVEEVALWVYLSLVLGLPVVLAGLIASRLDLKRFEALVSEAAPATPPARPAASDPDSLAPGA